MEIRSILFVLASSLLVGLVNADQYKQALYKANSNNLSRNRTTVRTTANNRRRNSEIPTNAVNSRRINTEIQRGATANGRVDGANRLSNRVVDGVAPDGSSVILTPVQEGAVQSLRTMLQTGQTRGTPRLIGFLIPTNDGRTRLRLMPAYLVRGPDGRETIRLDAEGFFLEGRGRPVNNAGMPLNLRTIVAAARRANLLPTNATEPQPTGTQRRPSMVVLRPRTGAAANTAINGAGRMRQNRLLQQQQRRPNQIQQQRNDNTGGDQVEVTINHTGPQTSKTQPTNDRTQQPGVPSQGRGRFPDTAGQRSRQRPATNNDRRLNFLDRSTGQMTSESNMNSRPQNRRVMNTIRRPQEQGNSIQDMGAEPLDLFNSPRSVNLIGSSAGRPADNRQTGDATNNQSNDQGRKVSITINTNQDPNGNNNARDNINPRDNNNARDNINARDNNINNQHHDTLRRDSFNRNFQNNAIANRINDHHSMFDGQRLGHGDANALGHDLAAAIPLDVRNTGHGHNTNDHHMDQAHHNDFHHNDLVQPDPTFIASTRTQSRASLPTTHDHAFDSHDLRSSHMMNRLPQDNLNSGQPRFDNPSINDPLSDNNVRLLQNNQLSGLSITDVFPGLQFNPQQTSPQVNMLQSNTPNIQQNTLFNQHNPQSLNFPPQNLQSFNNAHQTIQPIQNTQEENLATLLQKVLAKLTLKNSNDATSLNTQLSSNMQSDFQRSHNNVQGNPFDTFPPQRSTNQDATFNRLPQTATTSTFNNPPFGQSATFNQAPQTVQSSSNANTIQSLLTNLLQSQTLNQNKGPIPFASNIQDQQQLNHQQLPNQLPTFGTLQNLNMHNRNTQTAQQTTLGNTNTQPDTQNLANMIRNFLNQNNPQGSMQLPQDQPLMNDFSGTIPQNQNLQNTHQQTDIPNLQRVVNIQMQNALQPQDFGLLGGLEHMQGPMSFNNMQQNRQSSQLQNTLQNNPLLASMANQLNNANTQGSNTFNQNPLNSLPLQNNQNNLALRQLLQQNIQQILMRQNSQLLGTPGFFGRSNVTKSFPNDQLAPSDLLKDATVTSQSTQKVGSTLLRMKPTPPSLFSTFIPMVTSTKQTADINGGLNSAINESMTLIQKLKSMSAFDSLSNNSLAVGDVLVQSNNISDALNASSFSVMDVNVTNVIANTTLNDALISASLTNLTIGAADTNLTDTGLLNVTDGFMLAENVTTFNDTLNATDVSLPTVPAVSPIKVEAVPVDLIATTTPVLEQTTVDILSSHSKLSNTLKKSLGVPNVDKATLKGLISNVLRDLFHQNFIDPVKGTLKSSLNYTTMLNSVKKVLLKSKDKLFNLKQRVSIPPDQMTTILQNRGLNTIPRHLQTRAASLIASHQQITPFITTQPATIQQPTLQPPTPSQVIVDSIGNQGVITNQNFGSQSGGGVAVWYSTQKDNHAAGNHVLSVPHLNSLSNPVVQPSGDLSGVGMAAPTGILPVTLPGSGASSISTTSNPFLQHVTDQPIDFMFTTPSPFPNNLGDPSGMSEPGGVPVFMPSG